MKLTRIYSPASEQTLATDEELKAKYGEDWKRVIGRFRTDRIEKEAWFSHLLKKTHG